MLPEINGEGKTFCIIAGSCFGKASPVRTFSKLFHADAAFESGASLLLNDEYEERAIYFLKGSVDIHGQKLGPGWLLVFTSGGEITIRALSAARFVLYGGEPVDSPASRLVEICLELARADRASQVGLEERPVRAGSR